MYIIEIKRTDISADAALSDKYKWLKIDKETLEITPFLFLSTDAAGEVEERYFEEGYLKFNDTIGTFIEKYNSAQHPLNRRIEWKMPIAVSNAVSDFLSSC